MDLWLLLPWIKRNHLRTPTEIGCFKYYYLFACFCCLWHICYAFNWFTNSHQISVVSSGEIQESRDTRFSVPTNSWNPTKQNPVYKNNCKNQILNPENWTKTWKFLRKEKKNCCIFLLCLPINSDSSVSPANLQLRRYLPFFWVLLLFLGPILSCHRLSKGHWACIAGRNLKIPPLWQVFPTLALPDNCRNLRGVHSQLLEEFLRSYLPLTLA